MQNVTQVNASELISRIVGAAFFVFLVGMFVALPATFVATFLAMIYRFLEIAYWLISFLL